MMKNFKYALIALTVLITTAASAEMTQNPGTGFMIIPAGDSIVLLGMVPAPSGAKGFRIYRKAVGGQFEKIAEKPVWSRNPDLLISELGQAGFDEMAKRFGAATPAELLHKSGSNPAINLTIVAMVPRYPRLIELFQDSYIYFDNTIVKDVTYEYVIRSYDAGGAETDMPADGELIATAGTRETPPMPADARAETGDSEVKLLWNRGSGNTVGTVDGGFLVYRREKDIPLRIVGYLIPLKGVEQAFINSDLENGVEYTFQISSLNPAGVESGLTDEIRVTPHDMKPPAPIDAIKVAIEDKFVTLRWQPAQEEDFAYYNIWRTEDPNSGQYIKANGTKLTATEYIDTTLVLDGKTYFYTVTAVDKFGNESMKVAPQYATTPDYKPPLAVTGLKADYDRGRKAVVLTWTPPADGDFSIYLNYRGDSKDALKQITTYGSEVTEIVDDQVKEGRTYYFAVKTQDRSSNYCLETPTVELTIPDLTPPPAPYNLEAKFTQGDPGIILTWADQRANDFDSYIVYRSQSQDGEYEKISFASDAAYTDTTAKKGITYWYRVAQSDKSGNLSIQCRPASAKLRDFEPPASPTEVKAEFKTDGIAVTWKPAPDDDVAGYNVYITDLFRYTESLATPSPSIESQVTIPYSLVGKEGNIGIRVTSVDTSDNESMKTEILKPE